MMFACAYGCHVCVALPEIDIQIGIPLRRYLGLLFRSLGAQVGVCFDRPDTFVFAQTPVVCAPLLPACIVRLKRSVPPLCAERLLAAYGDETCPPRLHFRSSQEALR